MRAANLGRLFLVASCSLTVVPGASAGCDGPRETREATAASIRSFVKGRRMNVVTFVGYSGAQYESASEMLDHAARVLETHKPSRTLVNIGATADGIGAVYALAKE